MEKKKIAKMLMLTVALAGGMTVAQSFFSKAQASGQQFESNSFWCCLGWGDPCNVICTNVPGQTQKW